ncbi:WG repeat-containing protein [uncultured Campylobacter sp.]|jgi:KWG|uniref:WG repeat-containing protein n=1 Tax=uncultured Campylobacter sp. TaxID=218934 RepID=UPI00260EA755|nr:WG repeat-containing protein [uncultured Campylobacter sp.]
MKQAYEVVGEFKEGLARIKKFGAYGFINEVGEQVIACNFSDASDFCEGLARVKKFGKFGFIDKNGEQVTRCKFDDASDFCNGLAMVKVNGKSFEIDTSGKEPNASESSDFDVVGLKKDEPKNNVEISKDSVKVVIDGDNKVEIPIKFDDVKSTTVVKNMVEIGGKWHEIEANSGSVNAKSEFFDKDNNKIVPSEDGAFVINDGDNKIEISTDGGSVFIGGDKKIEIPLEPSDLRVFKEGSTVVKNMVKINGKWQDMGGEEKFSQNDIKVVPLKDGNFMVEDSNGGKVEISKNGSAIVKESYKNQNLAHPSGNVTLKKGYIKPKKVRDWFIEKKKESDEGFTITGTLGIVYNILKFIIRLFKR